MRSKEANKLEPLKRCRKTLNDVKTRVLNLLWDKLRRCLIYCLGGIRHTGGVTLDWAPVRNVGTCRSDDKGETQVEVPLESEYRCRAQGHNNS
jgi:hypothetical protein